MHHFLFYIAQNYSYAILRPLQQEILRQGHQVAWFLEGNEVDSRYLTANETQLLTIKDIKNWKPDAVFVPGNTVPNFIPGLKVDVFHGFNSGKVNRRGREDHFEIRHCFDLYCTQGPATTKKFTQLAAQYKTFRVIETGWPTLDPLFKPITNNPYIDDNDKRKTVLFCSTFSRNLTCAPHVFDEIKRLADTKKWRWLVQFHPKMDKSIVDKYKSIKSENLTFIETDNVLPLLQAADIMLCDTSSILLMFLLQLKPVVTFKNQAPSDHLINITALSEIETALEYGLSRPKGLMAKIENYCDYIHPYRDSLSSARILTAVNNILNDDSFILNKKPSNFIRQFKMRKKLNYWGF